MSVGMELNTLICSWWAKRPIRKQAEQVLMQHLGPPVSLRFSHFLRIPSVCRLHVLASPIALGESLICKAIRRQEHPGEVSTRYPAPTWMFYNEWAGLRFLHQEIPTAAIAPRLIAAAHTPALILMEDLHPVTQLSTVLQGHDARWATEALTQWGGSLGTLHAGTIGKHITFTRLRDALAPRTFSWGWVPPWQRSAGIYQHLVESVPAPIREQGVASGRWMLWTLHQICDFLAVPLPSQIEAELATVAQQLSSPGPFLAYTHGDLCGENCLVTKHGLTFVDFENGEFRSALIDAVFPRMGFPTCWNGRQVPLAMVEHVEQHYRTALITGCPAASDDRVFARALVAACTFWTLLPCQFHAVSRLTASDPSFCPPSQQTLMQQRLLFRFDRLAQTTAALGCLEGLGDLFHQMSAILRRRWPAETAQLPFYPVFT